jgi:2-polyprenyl-6-methoxyphenol hydroxylase-like FAD-dependent oxidoreductase
LRTETDILIVGAGPTGLMLAAELRRLGIDRVLTVDRRLQEANTSRAAVVHARTLEVLEPLEVTPMLIEQAVKVPIFRALITVVSAIYRAPTHSR